MGGVVDGRVEAVDVFSLTWSPDSANNGQAVGFYSAEGDFLRSVMLPSGADFHPGEWTKCQ